ncbi:PSD1 and planctomycete cytochrome C domain-containing protein [Planctomycetaceae bacterium SH139]
MSSLLSPILVTAAEQQPISYNRDIRPLLSDKCFHCHGPDEGDRQAELRLDQAAGEQGAYRDMYGVVAVKPGVLAESEVWLRITSEDPDVVMPPADSHKRPFTKAERELIRQWIEQGAKYEAFWAFVPPTLPTPPDVDADGDAASAIDRFVIQRLQEAGLVPKPRTDRRSLIRRLSFDLTGLPPTCEQIEAFISDTSPDAYERLVDRLLNSPHYGEHMAKYWLDLVRFADTNGIHHDHFRDLSPYRDWVIRSFNENLSYDDFVRYQIAGDLYPNPQQDQLIASGFNRLHLIIDVGTMLPEESFTRNVIDRVSSVGTAFLGLTMQCAVCHDHKYDPITAKDFFSMAGYFNNIDATPETGGRRGTDFTRGLQPPYINLPSPQQAEQLEQLSAIVERLRDEVAELEGKVKENKSEAVGDDAAKAKQSELANNEAALANARKKLQAAQREHDDLLVTIPAAMIMKEREEIRPSHVLIRGAYDNPGAQVERATPGFLPAIESKHEVSTRMDLANWLVDPQHPLTSRVAVNRFWQQLFGVGIVRTSEDFGAQGEWPSHPELLDYLAVRFVESGWDVKGLMKEMVMSQAYQQSAVASPESYRRDPDNRLLSRGSRYRMDAEMIRDQILFASGLLNPKQFGKSVKPPQPEGLWKAVSLPSSYPREYNPDKGEQIYRRSVYTFWKRAMPPPQMTIFNAPSREECIARRERTNTPLQALLLLNEQEYIKAARHLANNTLANEPDDNRRLRIVYETITSQLPDEQTEASLLALVGDLEKMYADSTDLATQLCGDVPLPGDCSVEQLAAWTVVTNAIFNLDVTKNRQ